MRRGTFVAGTIACASGLAVPHAAPAASGDLPVVTVGTIPSDTAAVVNYARDLGEFTRAGLDVRISIMNNGPTVAAAVTGGALDVGAMNSGSLAVARARGVPLKFFAPCALQTPATKNDVIMVRGDSPIRTGADLNGKTVGIVAVKTMQYAAALAWIDKHGGDAKTVKFIEVPFPQMVGALDQARVDAAIPSEPFASIARAKGHRVIGYTYDAMAPRFMLFGFAATDRWLQARPDLAVKFAAAIRKAATWANAHHEQSAAMLVALTKVDPALARSMERATYGTTLDPSLIQPVIDVIAKYGILERPIDPNELVWHA
jgi:NitT/TauT family transport system substrate-binding protein